MTCAAISLNSLCVPLTLHISASDTATGDGRNLLGIWLRETKCATPEFSHLDYLHHLYAHYEMCTLAYHVTGQSSQRSTLQDAEDGYIGSGLQHQHVSQLYSHKRVDAI